jgi:2,3-bisphosphoglycerate-independent phosphoglycerate mutase
MDFISTGGRQGIVRTVPEGFEPGSDVAQMSLLGYDPRRYYCGRAPIEAAARGIELGPRDWVFRCNLVTISDGRLSDHSAGQISTGEASKLIDELNERFATKRLRFHCGVSYRHLLVCRDCEFDVRTWPPHDNIGRPVEDILPSGRGSEMLIELTGRSRQLFAGHEINRVRRDLSENQVSSIWLWGHGKSASLESFERRYGVKGAAVAAVDLARGLSVLAGLDCVDVPGATGFVDTNYEGKGAAAIRALEDHDFVFVHVEAPDEASHGGDALLKKKAVELIDEKIVGPVLRALQGYGSWRIMVAPDHPTPVAARTHSNRPVPFAMAGTGVQPVFQTSFSEANAAGSGIRIEEGHELMEYFLRE